MRMHVSERLAGWPVRTGSAVGRVWLAVESEHVDMDVSVRNVFVGVGVGAGYGYGMSGICAMVDSTTLVLLLVVSATVMVRYEAVCGSVF